MKLFDLETLGVRGVADGRYLFGDANGPRDRVLVFGEPGSGKTRLLELIVALREMIAPADETLDEDDFIRAGETAAKVVARFSLSPSEAAAIGAPTPLVDAELIFGGDSRIDAGLAFLLGRYDHSDQTPKLEYFSERRRLDVGGGDMPLDEEHQKRFRIDGSPRKHAFVPGLLARLRGRPAEAQRFARGLAGLSRALRYDLERHVLVSGTRDVASLKELSASEADAVIFAATATLVGLSSSIVLVDGPEQLGLDPSRALAGIAALGEDNQIVFATSSPEVATGFPGAVVALSTHAARF